MRELEPFSYFIEHTSAIKGFGGGEQAPDPRYCFHTHYEELRPGRAIYRLRMTGARASKGELTLRVHAYKAGSNSDVSLVAGAAQALEGIGAEGRCDEIELNVGIVAVRGVQYALYGYFSEPSDLHVENIVISLDEPETTGDDLAGEPPPRSRFVADGAEVSSRLYADAYPSLRIPVSQDCTADQVQGGLAADGYANFERWRTDIVLAALGSYGLLQGGAAGAIVGGIPNGLEEALKERACSLEDEGTDLRDFVISYALAEPTLGPAQRYQAIRETMLFLTQGGLAMFVLRYRALPCAVDFSFSSRNEIEQWALRLIGLGHDVAQLAFVTERQRLVLDDGSIPFVLIARRG